ncbi:MAG: hypothetical protein HKN20_04495, partial [Gemmatimonadetes bacterium]|nr:hypothetical protein [Gemmatimonadota bacterium]
MPGKSAAPHAPSRVRSSAPLLSAAHHVLSVLAPTLALLALALTLAFAPAVARADIEVRMPASEPRTFATSEWNGVEYITADDVSLIYSASLYWRPELQKMTLRLGDFHVKVTAENPNVVIDERVIHLGAPVLFREGHMQLPLDFVTNFLPDLCPYPVLWRPEPR